MSATWKTRLRTCVQNACVAEVSAVKPGNVSPSHSFANATADDFVASAKAIAPVIADVSAATIGQTILQGVAATQRVVDHNTNLGIILLLTPLAAVPEDSSLEDGIEDVLKQLSVEDAVLTYRAIQLASPGGLGNAETQDVDSQPTIDLRACMKLAADRDLIAAQYTNGFHDVLHVGLPLLLQTAKWDGKFQYRAAWLAVRLLAAFGDSLIARKCGKDASDEAQNLAQQVVDSGWPHQAGSDPVYMQLDRFLKLEGNRRNPGTTADMIAAIFFASLRNGHCRFNDLTNELMFIHD